MLGGALRPEEVDGRSERDDEVVVVERSAVGELDGPLHHVDRGHRSLMDRDVRLVVEEIAERVPHRVRVEQVGRNLVEQRLEGVVVVLVDEDDVRFRAGEFPSGSDSAEPSA